MKDESVDKHGADCHVQSGNVEEEVEEEEGRKKNTHLKARRRETVAHPMINRDNEILHTAFASATI